MGLANIELRYRFWQVDFLEQHLGFYAIPFVDAGGVWNTLTRSFQICKTFAAQVDPALKYAWNEDTILRFDYGISPEGAQFYFGIGQIF